MGFLKRIFSKKDATVVAQQREQAEMNQFYNELILRLSVHMYQHASHVIVERIPGLDPAAASPIAAHVKLYVTGEGDNEKSRGTSTPEQRNTAARLAEEIMALPVSGLYLRGDLIAYAKQIDVLLPCLESIKQLALGFDQVAAILILSLATDISSGMLDPQINKEMIRQQAVPLIQNALRYDPTSSDIHATAAQTYYTLDDIETGFPFARRSVELNAENAEGWRLVGNGYMRKNEDAAAKAAFDRALSIAPNIVGVHEALSLLNK